MSQSDKIKILDLSYIDQDAKINIGCFVRTLYKIAEAKKILLVSKNIYENKKSAVYQNAITEERDLYDSEKLTLCMDQSMYLLEKMSYKVTNSECKAQLEKVYKYFFGSASEDADLFCGYIEMVENRDREQFRSRIIEFFEKIGCIEADATLNANQDKYFRNIFSRLCRRTLAIFLDDDMYIANGRLVLFQPVDCENFFKIVLWTLFEDLEKHKIVVYNYEEDETFLSQPKYRKRPHDFTNEEYFRDHYINVYGNIINKCTEEEHDSQTITALVEDLYTERHYEINMEFCPKCGEYFMYSSDIFLLRESQHKNPKLRYNPVRIMSVDGQTNSESILKLYGYAVGRTSGRDPYFRKRLISALIEKEVATANEINGLIFALISMAKGKNSDMSSSISDWERDMQFVEENF